MFIVCDEDLILILSPLVFVFNRHLLSFDLHLTEVDLFVLENDVVILPLLGRLTSIMLSVVVEDLIFHFTRLVLK